MKKILKNGEIDNIIRVLNGEETKDIINKRLPIKVAWSLKTNLLKLSSLGNIIEESINNIKSEYLDDEHSVISEKDKDMREIKVEYRDEYVNKINELLNQENEIDIKTCSIKDLEIIKDISVSELMALDFMIEDVEDTEDTE